MPRIQIMVNKAPESLDHVALARQVEQIYDCPVAAVLPHSDDLMLLASEGLFVLRNPDHPLSDLYRLVAGKITSPA